MAETSPQRAYRAACPGCGAPVEFRSAQSTHAVCGYCQSTVVRHGEVLQRLGKMAELFDDHSLLQLGAAGRFEDRPFMLVGRLQYRYGQGTWTEWWALFDDGATASLSEDNGAYVLSFPREPGQPLPEAAQFRPGASVTIDGQRWAVASNESVALIAAQGELPHLPPLGQSFAVVELRSQSGSDERVLSLDYGSTPPSVSLGQPVTLDALAMTGLKAESAREEKGRQFACPHCGAPVQVQLEATRSITCGACNSLIDLSGGLGGELAHAVQDEPVRPLIALGSVGQLQGAAWQVVGFQHRVGTEPDDPDEQFGWDEYLLYNARQGFAFLVDAEDGWSLVRPATGAPELAANGQTAKLGNQTYKLDYAYEAVTTYVAGEFYWRVERGQRTRNRDFSSGKELLSMEQSDHEVTWSRGARMDSAAVAKAFGRAADEALFKRGDAAPTSSGSGLSTGTIVFVVILIIIVLSILESCEKKCDPTIENCAARSTYRSSGGSFGGSSSGGSHK